MAKQFYFSICSVDQTTVWNKAWDITSSDQSFRQIKNCLRIVLGEKKGAHGNFAKARKRDFKLRT